MLGVRAAYAAWRAQTIGNIGDISQTIYPTVDELTDSMPAMNTVANTAVAQTEVAVLAGGQGLGSGRDASGKGVTMETLGLRSFTATVKTISTDEGELYELEKTE